MENVELIVSANGCTDNTKAYLDYLKTAIPNLEVVWNYNAVGFAKAVNATNPSNLMICRWDNE